MYCKVCVTAKQKELRARRYKQVRAVEARSRFKYKDIQSVRNRLGHLRRKYGLTAEDFNLLLASQAGCCASCGRDITADTTQRAHIDHDHETGSVRGILCHGCNVSLGLLGDDPAKVESLLAYVRRFK